MEVPTEETKREPEPKGFGRTKACRTCQLDFCRAKTGKWSRLRSVNTCVQLDKWMGPKGGGFEQAKRGRSALYVCTKHVREAERRKAEAQMKLDPEGTNKQKKEIVFCSLDFCRVKTANWRRLVSSNIAQVEKAREVDTLLGREADGIEHAMKKYEQSIYVCEKHYLEAERRKIESQLELDSEETSMDDGPQPTRRCCLAFCREKTTKFSRLKSLNSCIRMDALMGLNDGGFAQAMRGRSVIYMCTKHIREAEKRKIEAQIQKYEAEEIVETEKTTVEVQIQKYETAEETVEAENTTMEGEKYLGNVLRVVEVDVTEFYGDAIVNDVGNYPDETGKLAELCESLIGTCLAGPSTTSNNNIQLQLNTSGPECFNAGFPTAKEERLLRLSYWNCLQLAVDCKVRKIGFPLIGTGLGGYPRGQGLMVALDTVLAFFETYPSDTEAIDVSLCLAGESARDIVEFASYLMEGELVFDTSGVAASVKRISLENRYTSAVPMEEKPVKSAYRLLTMSRFSSYVPKYAEEECPETEKKNETTNGRVVMLKEEVQDGEDCLDALDVNCNRVSNADLHAQFVAKLEACKELVMRKRKNPGPIAQELAKRNMY